MEKQTDNLEEAIQRMQKESKARGILRLTEIYGRIFTNEELTLALEHSSLNVENAAIYLQDHLPTQSTKVPSSLASSNPEFPSIENIYTTNPHKHPPEPPIIQELVQIPCPTTGKIALEFSQSPQYINCTIPVIYVSDEILKEIFSFLSASDRGKLASLCKSLKMIDSTTEFLYKRDCLKHWVGTSRPEKNVFGHPYDSTDILWGDSYPNKYRESREYLRSFGSWRNMWVKRPKIRFNGVYVSRVCYFKQGAPNMDNLPSFHKVVFYRFLRFYPDFSVCCMNTAKKPREMARLVNKSHSECRLGEWAKKDTSLRIHLQAKTEVFTYDLELRSSQSALFDLLKLEKVQSRSVSEQQYYELNINNDAWPRYFGFRPLNY